jgi:tetrahydromethanopterin S-methyltransferase subunit F
MVSVFFGDIVDPSGVDLTVVSLIVGLVFSGILTVWQSTENRRTQNRLIAMARHYELRTALINLGYIFSGGDKRIQQNEINREKFVKELEQYGVNVEKNPQVEKIHELINQHSQFPGTFLHHCKQCHSITELLDEFLNDSKYQNTSHHYNTLKFEVPFGS